MNRPRAYLIILILSLIGLSSLAQGLPTDGPLTIRPMLQQLGERLLKGKTGSIVAINPENGEIICLASLLSCLRQPKPSHSYQRGSSHQIPR